MIDLNTLWEAKRHSTKKLDEYKADNAKHISITTVIPEAFGAVADANYFDSISCRWYVDSGYTTYATDNTQFFQDAINYCAGLLHGGTVLCNGNYLIDSIEVKSKVRLKFSDFRRPYFTQSVTDFSTYTIGFCRNDNPTNHGVIARQWAYLENVMVLGGNRTDLVTPAPETYNIYVDHEAFVENIYSSKGWHGIYINDSNVDGVFSVGNEGDGIYFYQAIDIWCRRWLASSNGGHGIVLDGCSAISFTQGKTEWNQKHNVYTVNYCQELNFNDCIIDSANWFNIYCRNSIYNIQFNDVKFIGGRWGLNGAEITSADIPTNDSPDSTILAYAMIFSQTSAFGASFTNCYFRRNSLASGNSANDRLTSILAFKNGLTVKTKAISFSGIDNPRLAILNPAYDTGSVANITRDGSVPNQPVPIMQADGITNTLETAPIDSSAKFYYYNDGCTVRLYPLADVSILDTTKLKSGVAYWDSTNKRIAVYDTATGFTFPNTTVYMGQDNVLLTTSIGDTATYPPDKIVIHNVTNDYAVANGFPEGIGGLLTTFNITTLYTIRHQDYYVGNYGTSSHKVYRRYLNNINAWSAFAQMPGNVLDFSQTVATQTVPANSGITVTITTTGSTISDKIYASPQATIPVGLVWQAYTITSDSIVLSLVNATTVSIVLPAVVWNIKVQK